jgi:molecular chaperone DnaK
MAGDSVDEIEAKTKALQIATVNFGAKVHEATAGTGSSGTQEQSSASSGDDVVDADFEEVDDRDGQRHG